MKSTEIGKGILKALAVVALILLAMLLLYKARTLIGYLAISAIVALIGRPIVVFLRRKLKFPNILAVVLFLILILGAVIAVIAMTLPVIRDQSENLTLLRVENLQYELQEIYREVSEAFGTSAEKVEQVVEDADIEKEVMDNLDKGFAPSIVSSVISVLTSIGFGLFSVLFMSFFFLKDSKIIQRLVLKSFPVNKQAQVLNSVSKIENLLPRYFLGLIFQMTILFAIYSVTLLVADIEHAIVIAFFCALFNIVPYLGPIIGGLIMLAFTVLGYLEPGSRTELLPTLGLVCLGIFIGQLIDNFFSQPYIFSNSVKSHPLEIFIVIILAGLLFGVIGMMAAVPAYTVTKVVLKEFFPESRVIKYITSNI